MEIWHNPRCSKSRAALALLTDRGVEPTVRRYLDDPPTRAELDGPRRRSRTIELDPRLLVPALVVLALVTSYCLFLLLTR